MCAIGELQRRLSAVPVSLPFRASQSPHFSGGYLLGSGNVVLLILYGGKIFTNVFDADRLKNCGRCVIL